MFKRLRNMVQRATIAVVVKAPLAVAGSLANNYLGTIEMGQAIKGAWRAERERVRVAVMHSNLELRSELEDIVTQYRKDCYLEKLAFFEALAISCSKAVANIPESLDDIEDALYPHDPIFPEGDRWEQTAEAVEGTVSATQIFKVRKGEDHVEESNSTVTSGQSQ